MFYPFRNKFNTSVQVQEYTITVFLMWKHLCNSQLGLCHIMCELSVSGICNKFPKNGKKCQCQELTFLINTK